MVTEFNRIIRSTSANGLSLIDGVDDSITIQQGVGAVNSLSVQIGQQGGVAAGSGAITSSQNLSSGAARIATLADFNGDGSLDAAFGAYNAAIRVSLNDGSGTLLASNALGYSGNVTTGMTTGDLNNDGKVDLIVTDRINNEVITLLGNGNGTFLAPSTISSLSGPVETSAVDVNSDGVLDLITAEVTANRVSVRLGNGDGSFKAALNNTVTSPGGVATGDLNGDGIMDIAVAQGNLPVSVLFGNGNGTFQAAVCNTDNVPTMVRIADVDGDGDNDLLSSANSSIGVFLNNGDGSFQVKRTYSFIGAYGGGNVTFDVADMNGDGIIDVVSNRQADNNIQIFIGNGNGSFLAATTTAIPGGTSSNAGVALGDLNGDGINDVVSANQNSSVANIFFGVADSTGRRNNFEYSLNLLTVQGAKEALSRTTQILRRTNAELGNLGAFRSRMDSSVNNLRSLMSGASEAYSRITDADVAEESAQLVKTRILKEATVAVLAQANQQPALALSLLK